MSVNMTTADGVTVLTLTSDPKSPCPPLCQVLKGLCYSPACCSVSKRLRRVQRTSQSVLGTLHIVVGLLMACIGGIFCTSGGGFWWRAADNSFPFLFGGIFVIFGIVSILSEKYPRPGLVILDVILNLIGVTLAITASIFYGINLALIWDGWFWWEVCQDDYFFDYNTPTPSPHHDEYKKKCLEGNELILTLARSISGVLIGLSVLELCVTISSAVLGIKALCSSEKRDNKSNNDPETTNYKPVLEEVTSNPTV